MDFYRRHFVLTVFIFGQVFITCSVVPYALVNIQFKGLIK